MKIADLRLVEEMVDKARRVPADARAALLGRIHEAVGDDIARWLLPMLLDPPSPAQLDELKAALRAHLKSGEMLAAALEQREPYWRFLAEVSDNAHSGTRALGVLARWIVGPPNSDEEDDGDPE